MAEKTAVRGLIKMTAEAVGRPNLQFFFGVGVASPHPHF